MTCISIAQIAHCAGYANRGSFLRAFRKTYGCDPSHYRLSDQQSVERPAPFSDQMTAGVTSCDLERSRKISFNLILKSASI
ncbi:MAG: helix-turn-helix domain-containing protein [Massilia sp.]